jgi:hypothetical protein
MTLNPELHQTSRSDFTSAQDRIVDLQAAGDISTADAQDNRIEHGHGAGWLLWGWNPCLSD